MNGREYALKAQVYGIDADDVFLYGKKILGQWGFKIGQKKCIPETCLKRDPIDYKMIRTNTVHFSIKLETQDKKDNEIMYLEAKIK